MSTNYAVITALIVGLVCGFAASESSISPQRGIARWCGETWYSFRNAASVLAGRRKSTADTVLILQVIAQAGREGRRIAEYAVLAGLSEKSKSFRESSRREDAAARCIDRLVDAGVLVRVIEGEGSPEEKFLTINNHKQDIAK